MVLFPRRLPLLLMTCGRVMAAIGVEMEKVWSEAVAFGPLLRSMRRYGLIN